MITKQDLIYNLDILVNNCQFNTDKTTVFKIKQYNDIIKIIKSFPQNNTFEKNNVIDFLEKNGKKSNSKIVIKIIEYFETGRIQEVEIALKNPKIKSLINLTKIYAIGPKKAIELFDKYQITDINLLRQCIQKDSKIINAKQHLGVKYYEDLNSRIPRVEIDNYYKVLEKICSEISDDLIFSINGSYRRNHIDSGDIDVLITSKNEDSSILRNKLINELLKQNIIVDILANGKKKFMGVVKLNINGYNIARHMDIMDTDFKTYPFAILYFTGSGEFNSNMRSIALKKGYSLNEYCISDKNTKKEIDKSIIISKIGKTFFETEKDIFDFLDLEYVYPENREIL